MQDLSILIRPASWHVALFTIDLLKAAERHLQTVFTNFCSAIFVAAVLQSFLLMQFDNELLRFVVALTHLTVWQAGMRSCEGL